MLHDPRRFPFTTALERHWHEILDEYRRIRAEVTDWPETELYGEGWKVFGLFDFPHGRPVAANVAQCPFTAALVAEHVGRHAAAGFSVLQARTHICTHRGYQGDFLRAHLALQVPAGDCGLRVQDEVRRWEPGRVLVFDDRVEHEAWNATDEERVILLLDFIPD